VINVLQALRLREARRSICRSFQAFFTNIGGIRISQDSEALRFAVHFTSVLLIDGYKN